MTHTRDAELKVKHRKEKKNAQTNKMFTFWISSILYNDCASILQHKNIPTAQLTLGFYSHMNWCRMQSLNISVVVQPGYAGFIYEDTEESTFYINSPQIWFVEIVVSRIAQPHSYTILYNNCLRIFLLKQKTPFCGVWPGQILPIQHTYTVHTYI